MNVITQTWQIHLQQQYFPIMKLIKASLNFGNYIWQYIDGLVQERHNSSALAMELRLSCTKPSYA